MALATCPFFDHPIENHLRYLPVICLLLGISPLFPFCDDVWKYFAWHLSIPTFIKSEIKNTVPAICQVCPTVTRNYIIYEVSYKFTYPFTCNLHRITSGDPKGGRFNNESHASRTGFFLSLLWKDPNIGRLFYDCSNWIILSSVKKTTVRLSPAAHPSGWAGLVQRGRCERRCVPVQLFKWNRYLHASKF